MAEQLAIADQVLGRRLSNARIEKKITTTDAAKAVGITSTYLEKIERGKSNCMKVGIIYDLCRLLDLPFPYIIPCLTEKSIEEYQEELQLPPAKIS